MNKIAPVVVVGGGAGGLELAAKLGRRFGPEKVYLIDKMDEHIWKPSLHEVAAGTLDIHREGLSYFMLARDNGFTFVPGRMHALDKENKTISLQAVRNAEGEELLPARTVEYGVLVMAVGSKSNFFNTPGAEEFAIALDSTHQAERFRMRLLYELTKSSRVQSADGEVGPLEIAIVGGGATGVELAAELMEANASLQAYGTHTLDQARSLHITLIEGADRVLAALPPKVSLRATQLLQKRGVTVHAGVRVSEVRKGFLQDTNGTEYPADLCVWAAGIKAPAFLTELGLEVNRINQLVVNDHLQTADPHIYALGDCAQAPWGDEAGQYLPARAQVAHQQAAYLIKVLAKHLKGLPVHTAAFEYKDYGSLVSVGHSKGVGSLMGVLQGRSWFVEGLVARTMYMSLHLMHHMAILGVLRTASMALGRLLLKRSAPRVKLH
ncbi:NAD(P)/FAD-dependent oxidoreductase [Paenalcaligenes sp. Me131]|uniref:NAD(P)/FAD-dependent oxidoreductase n=1 Tax=Paenalcaligenes sp. Me131 TaxID=3392636 RepID=UPI003D2D127B